MPKSDITDLAEHWRGRAEEVLDMADKAHDPGIRADLLEIAASYEGLADLATKET